MRVEDRELAERVLAAARGRGLRLAVAESDTGGLVLAWLVAVPGSSAAVVGGVVAYDDHLKVQLLGVAPDLIREHGAVSAAVAGAMASGLRQRVGCDLALAGTGIAGPGGARPGKPVGLAFVAAAQADHEAVVREYHWPGARSDNQRASARAMLSLGLELLQNA